MSTFRENFKKFRRDPIFYVSLVTSGITVALAIASVFVDYETKRYTVHALWVGGFAALIVTVWLLVKAYKKYFKEDGVRLKGKIAEKILNFFIFIEDNIRRILHLSPRVAYFGGHDERVKLYTVPDTRPKARGMGKDTKVKWKNIEENRMKIRYLYAQLLGKAIGNGYKFKYSSTARQIKKDLSNTERTELLFELYEDIRYTDHGTEVEDETVEYLLQKDETESKEKKKRR